MTGVNGSLRANQRTAPDIVSVGTNAPLTNGNTCTSRMNRFAPSAFFAASPTATASQVSADASSNTSPGVPAQVLQVAPQHGRRIA
ncbi:MULTISPECIES: hypothetical protein [unclassified Amycolatopsis]|uniref:hypothetical protein n=1 Tax=unclassified Amycolatopsis TaxID=2618356 RepID=UPI00287BAB63|nr:MULTISPECIES: hypothetical protein [unclassified Amycolatopsis]